MFRNQLTQPTRPISSGPPKPVDPNSVHVIQNEPRVSHSVRFSEDKDWRVLFCEISFT